MKLKDIFKNKNSRKILISGILFCFVLISIVNMYETFEIDQYSGRTRISYQILIFITVYSYENDTDFSKQSEKFVVHSPKWQIDTSYKIFSNRKVSEYHYYYHGAISDTWMIALLCSNFDMTLEDQEALYQFALKILANYREDRHFLHEIFGHLEQSKDGHGIQWKEIIEDMKENMENNPR